MQNVESLKSGEYGNLEEKFQSTLTPFGQKHGRVSGMRVW